MWCNDNDNNEVDNNENNDVNTAPPTDEIKTRNKNVHHSNNNNEKKVPVSCEVL